MGRDKTVSHGHTRQGVEGADVLPLQGQTSDGDRAERRDDNDMGWPRRQSPRQVGTVLKSARPCRRHRPRMTGAVTQRRTSPCTYIQNHPTSWWHPSFAGTEQTTSPYDLLMRTTDHRHQPSHVDQLKPRQRIPAPSAVHPFRRHPLHRSTAAVTPKTSEHAIWTGEDFAGMPCHCA